MAPGGRRFTEAMAPGAGLLAGRALRGGRWSLLGLALVVALGGGVSITAAVAAYRTDHAYGDYVHDAAIGDLVVNPSIRTRRWTRSSAASTAWRRCASTPSSSARWRSTEPTPFAEAVGQDPWLQVRGSVDGRYVDVDRPAVSEGRAPSGEQEVFVSSDYHAELERILDRPLAVGDHIDVAFFWAGSSTSRSIPRPSSNRSASSRCGSPASGSSRTRCSPRSSSRASSSS